AGDRFVEATDYSPRLPHEKSSLFSLTYAMVLSCSRADERRCGLGGETSTESEEKRCLKRRKEDFREAMRLLKVGCHYLLPFIILPHFSSEGKRVGSKFCIHYS